GGHRDRRPRTALDPARGLHDPGQRDHGRPRRRARGDPDRRRRRVTEPTTGGTPATTPAQDVTAPADGSVAQWTDRYTHAVMDTFGPPQRVLMCGDGSYVCDAVGKRYLDPFAGIAVN